MTTMMMMIMKAIRETPPTMIPKTKDRIEAKTTNIPSDISSSTALSKLFKSDLEKNRSIDRSFRYFLITETVNFAECLSQNGPAEWQRIHQRRSLLARPVPNYEGLGWGNYNCNFNFNLNSSSLWNLWKWKRHWYRRNNYIHMYIYIYRRKFYVEISDATKGSFSISILSLDIF